jgi:DNA-directed RNA polymerase subunit RPC12/RpoP
MKTGRYGIESIAIWCPNCGEIVDDPRCGSQFFTKDEYDIGGGVAQCRHCQEWFRKPKWPKQRLTPA